MSMIVFYLMRFLQLAEFEQGKKELKMSSIPIQVELKPFPSHLEYTSLGDDSTNPIIVTSEVNGNDLDRLVNLVKKH